MSTPGASLAITQNQEPGWSAYLGKYASDHDGSEDARLVIIRGVADPS
jgi:hypothetical protein